METLQPKLRFPEFDGNWELIQLKQITSLITKGTTPQNFSENGINFIKIECLNGHNIDTSKCLFIDEKTHTKELKRSILKENDLLFAIAGATIGKCTIVTKEALPANTNQALAIIRLKENENKDYIFQILTSEGMSKYIKDNISVGAQPNLNLEQINSFSFSYPSIGEQSKIANFLSAVDEKLNLLKEKKVLLEEYKKGIMQKIFNQEIRFKDDNGNDFEDWGKKTLGEIADFFKGKGLPKNDISEDGKYKCIHYGELFTKYDELIKNIISKTNIYDKPFLSISNDVLMPTSDVTPNGLATASCILEDDVILGGDVLIIRQQDKILSGLFLSYYITQFRDKVMKLVSGSTVYHLYGSDMKKLDVLIPSLKEQIKITNFLSAIDEKIEIVSNQIQDTQEYKKGLLQQMFV